jgi:hypothetical protein
MKICEGLAVTFPLLTGTWQLPPLQQVVATIAVPEQRPLWVYF